MISWWRHYKQRKERAAYMDGFGWALTAFYLEKMTVQEIRSKLGELDVDSFDDGAYYGSEIIIKHLFHT